MDEIIKRRLILAKEFYDNAVNLSRRIDPLSKMMAVHNFHISIEITLKSVLLHYDIRSEKTLNIDFETMLNDIDKHESFASKGIKIPYRQDLRMLNQKRNMVQHHVLEPEKSSMDDWNSISRRFLEQAYKKYFEVEFNEISRLAFIVDDRLKSLIARAQHRIETGDGYSAACYLAAVYKYCELSISGILPSSSASFFIKGDLRRANTEELQSAFKRAFDRIDEVALLSAILSSGVVLSDYRRLKDTFPATIVMAAGNLVFQTFEGKDFPIAEIAWACEYLTSQVLRWQIDGLNPGVPEYLQEGADKLMAED